MSNQARWLTWVVPLAFLGLLLGVALYRDPDFWRSAPALHRLALAAAQRGEESRARELARKAWAREPGNSRYGLLLAQLHLDGGQPQAALEVSRGVRERDPSATGAVKIQAQALDRLGQRQAALELLAGYLADKEDPEVLKAAGDLAARRQEDSPLAVTYLQRLYKLAPDHQCRRQLIALLVSLNRFPEAIPLAEEEAAQAPEDPEALHRLALLHCWARDYQAACQVYQRLLTRSAQDEALRLEAAQAADQAQNLDQALAHYLWLYGHFQGKKEYALALARLWARKGNHAEAAGVLAPLMAEKPEPEVRRWYGLELLLIGDLPQALAAYEAAWREGDTHEETIVNLARLYAQRRQFDKAVAMWDEAGRRQLLKGGTRWEAALTYSYARRYPEALEVLAPLQREEPRNPRLLLFLGQLHFYQKHWGQAAQYFRSYLEQNPRDVEVRQQLAEVLSFTPETRDAALTQYQEVLKEKDDVRLRLRRIHLLLEERRWPEAARELKACPLPEDPGLLRDKARLYLWLGDLPEALQHFDLFLKKEPQDKAGRLEKARVLTYLGRVPEALDLFNRLRLDAPRDPAVRVAAIEAYLAAKDYSKALTLAQKELETLPDLSPGEKALVARCYCHRGDPQDLRRATQLLLENLRQNRHHHPSLLLLAYVLPRLPRYEDLNHVMNRLPGLRLGSPESSAALAYFDGQLGRQGGKLNYLLHALNEYRHRGRPDSPGELLGLAWLATELGDLHAAARYYDRALKLRPGDKFIAELQLKCRLARKDWGQALAALGKDQSNPGAPLEMARVYLMRGQYEGVKAMCARIPEGHPDRVAVLLLKAQALRLERQFPEALKTCDELQGRIPRSQWLMEKARVLEGMGDKAATGLYEEIIVSVPDSQEARVARARRARALGNWAAAHKAYAQALKEAPQDVELLNELEDIRQKMRPQLASRGAFPQARGLRHPEEGTRPWQFSRFDREPGGLGLTNYLPALVAEVLPLVQPETLGFTDKNKLYGGIFRLSSAFWITKVLPAEVSVEYREYNQNINQARSWEEINIHGWPEKHYVNRHSANRLRRLEVSLGVGPLAVEDRLKVAGELIFRRYWKRVEGGLRHRYIDQWGDTHYLPTIDLGSKEDRNRLMGSLEVKYQASPGTEAALRFSRRDIFDQDAHLYPRLYQGILNLEKAQITTVDQVELGYRYQFRPGLDWRGNVGGGFFSDKNRRLTLFQGLAWQALRDPRMHLEFTPHYYFAAYRNKLEAYFSPHAYHALGLGLDFDRQIFRLPTLILQATVQGVGQHGNWGPAFQGLAALEWEWVQNFYTNLHFFYFREWVDNYYLLTTGVSFRWHF
jgi:tetratricopeptide (TPR) repeat protein